MWYPARAFVQNLERNERCRHRTVAALASHAHQHTLAHRPFISHVSSFKICKPVGRHAAGWTVALLSMSESLQTGAVQPALYLKLTSQSSEATDGHCTTVRWHLKRTAQPICQTACTQRTYESRVAQAFCNFEQMLCPAAMSMNA